jgi:hypothetical protein
MTSEVLTQTVGAGATVTFGRGRIFNLLQASSPVTIVLEAKSVQGGQTAIRKFVNIPAGSKFTAKAGEEWTFLRLTSAAAQNITLFVGDDDMSFNNAVTVTGVAVVAITPSSVINSPAATALAGNTTDGTGVPANAGRKRVTVYNLAASAGSIRVSDTGVTGRGVELQAGTFAEFDTTATLAIRCDTASGATWGYFEES